MAKGKSKAGATGGGTISGIMGAGGGSSAVAPQNLPQTTNTVAPPTPQQVASGNVLPGGGVPFDQFQQMTDDQKADVVDKALRTGVPVFLDDSGLQRFAYFTGMSDKPTVVSDAQLDTMSGREMFRTVNNSYNPRTDIGYTSSDIVKQISTGDFTMFSDSGGSAYGRGIYFATSYTGSCMYGYSSQNPKVMRAKVTGGKTTTVNQASRDFSNALARGDKLARACARAESASQVSLYALAKGYSVLDCQSSHGYHIVLNRGALTVSQRTKSPTGSRW